MNDNFGLIVHPEDFDEILNQMSDAEAGLLFKSMIRTFKGEKIDIPDDRYLGFCVKKICGRVERETDISKKRSMSGKKGGAPVGNDNASKQNSNKKQAKNKQISSKKQAKTNSNNQIPITNIPIKDIYGEAKNVYLSAEEYQKIKDKGLTDLIEELSLYMASKHKTYADHYMTILAWGRRREKETKTKENNFTKGVMTRANDYYDYDKLIKN